MNESNILLYETKDNKNRNYIFYNLNLITVIGNKVKSKKDN